MRAIIISSDKEEALFLNELLEKYGCRVDYSQNADSGVKRVKSVEYDIVFMADRCVGKLCSALDVAQAVRDSRMCNKAEIYVISSGRTTASRMRSTLRGRIRFIIEKHELRDFPFSSIFRFADTESAVTTNKKKEKGYVPRRGA